MKEEKIMNNNLTDILKPKIIAVDFDGTLCENNYPEIGKANVDLISDLITTKEVCNSKLILWTCRRGERLEEAVKWCLDRKLKFDAVNENLPETIEEFGGDARKIFADVYIDDKNLKVEEFRVKPETQSWAENEVRLACLNEEPNYKDGEWYYGTACYQSALKAYNSLMEDGHSGASFGFTKQILNRLLAHKPLTPIKEEDGWNEVAKGQFQSKRYSSLFKYDGKYDDIDRVVCIHKGDTTAFYNPLATSIINKMFPISLPYIPLDNEYKVYAESFKCGEGRGDYDTIGFLYVECPNGDKLDLNRFFKENSDEILEEIDKNEYDERFKNQVFD